MAAYFNLFAGFVALYKPRLMFPCYPPAIIKRQRSAHQCGKPLLLALICFGELLPLLLYGAVVPWRVGQQGSGLWP